MVSSMGLLTLAMVEWVLVLVIEAQHLLWGFLRGRMAQMREQQGMLPPPQIPGLPPQPRPQMPQQLAGIMQLQDRSNISPAMRYAAENYNRLGGRQMTNDEYERGRAMIQGQSV